MSDQKTQTVRQEIEREDATFLIGGIAAIIIVVVLLIIGLFFLIRVVLLPSTPKVVTPLGPTPTPESDTNAAVPVLKDVNAVPLTWEHMESKDVGIKFAYPPEATISAAPNSLTIDIDGEKLVLSKQALTTDTQLDNEVEAIRKRLDAQNPDKVSLVKQTTIAGIDGYTFTITDGHPVQYIFLKKSTTAYLQVVVTRTDMVNGNTDVADTILNSIEFTTDNNPVK